MHQLDSLDIMIAYSCNLACQGCISISDQPRDGIEPYENIVQQIDQWKSVVCPTLIVIFGGEPCLHPKLIEICKHVRTAWPNAVIRLITNGYLLDNFDADCWFELGKFEMQVSIHRKDHEHVLNQKIKNILVKRKSWTVTTQHKHNQNKRIQWQHNSVSIYKSIFKNFVVPYQRSHNQILPWNSNPADAHKICGAPNSPILYKGKLYKCPAVANAIDITKQNWFKYQAVGPSDNLTDFINSIGVPEPVCGQCPAREQAVIIDHFDRKKVVVKQKNID